jgi:hypothetical protein
MSFSIPNTLNLVKNTPITLPPTYSGAPDWVSITGSVANEVLLLVSDATNGLYRIRTTFTRPASQNIYIDWGDGSPIDTISTTTTTDTTHTYTTGGTPSTRGYNTWKVRIYGDAGTRITQAQVIKNTTTDIATFPSGLIQAWYGDNTVTSMNAYFRNASNAPNMPFLEYVRVPEGLTDGNGLANTFEGCGALQKVDLPTSLSAITSLSLTFVQCGALQELSDFPVDMTGVTTMASAFQDCFALPKIIFKNTFPVLTSISSTFRQCWSLGWLELPPLPNCVTYDNAFLNAYTIRSVNFSTIRNAAVSMSGTFQNCRKLQNVVLDPNTTATINLAGTFSSCINLKLINLPPNCIITSYAGTFTSCNSLLEVSLPMNGSQITSFQQTFQNCFVLQQITLPSTPPTATLNFASAFQACNAINEVIIPNGYLITNMANTFSFCYALQNVSLPQSLSGCTSYSNCFQESGSIEYITLPTNCSSVTTIGSMFQNCYSLKEVIFPTSMNACTSIGNLFNSCASLQRVVFPTSMSSLGTGVGTLLVNIFSGCRQLRSVVFPSNAPLTAVTNFQGMFNGCVSLQSVTLPASTSGNLITLVNFLTNTPSLTGITNTDFLGNPNTATTTIVNGTTLGDTSGIFSLDFRCKFSKLDLNGTNTTTNKNRLNSLRLRNTGTGQYTGVSPQINLSFTDLGQAALVQVFNDLPTVTARTINITSATGAAALTAGERAIATGKGWTIVG